jgi:uncharacterized membrane protein (Fun14 family)
MKFFYGEFAGAQPLFYERYVGFEIFGKSLARTSHNRFGGRLGYGTLFPVLGVYGYAVGYAVKKNYGVALQNVINRFALFYYLGFAYHQNIGKQIIQTRVFAPLARTRTQNGAQSISVAQVGMKKHYGAAFTQRKISLKDGFGIFKRIKYGVYSFHTHIVRY